MKGSGKKKKVGFVAFLFEPGRIVTIWGLMGAGKSNYTVLLIEKAIEKYYRVFTNILFFDEDEIETAKKEGLLDPNIEYKKLPPEIVTVTKISQLLLGLNATKHKKITILDEASLFGSGTMAKEKKVTWLKELVTSVLRKMNSSLILIAQDKGSVVPMLREELPSIEIRIQQNKRTGERIENIFEIPDDYGITQEPKLLDRKRNVPQTAYPFDSRAFAKFKFDLDFDEFLDRGGEYNSLKIRNVLPKIVEELVEDFKQKNMKGKRKITKTDLIFLMLKNRPELQNSEIRHALKDIMGISVSNELVTHAKRDVEFLRG